MKTSLDRVALFLDRFKKKAMVSGLAVVQTRKNRDELANTGLMPHQRTAAILDLAPEEYCEGPMADDDGSQGEVWIFGKVIGGITVYIKLKLCDVAECLSFHVAEYPLEFPFRNK